MIRYTRGNLLDAESEALVNTVNCVGVMGKGIALQFRQAFPECFKEYKRACDAKEVQPGRMHVYEAFDMIGPKYIVNFPTKRHWKGSSRMEDVSSGLDALRTWIEESMVHSIAVPPLGCGNGGLPWEAVRALMEEKLAGLDEVEINLYEPVGAPANKAMAVATKSPNMTRGRAALLAIFKQYLVPGYELSLLEIQKLAYLLQEAGEPLRLDFEKQQYGPYAETLQHVLQRIEGHFIRGYGDRSSKASIEVYEEAMGNAERMLEKEFPETLERTEQVKNLIEGFETPYGLELLSTVDWVMKHESAYSEADAVAAVHAWNPRKAEVFKQKHIALAWQRLKTSRSVPK